MNPEKKGQKVKKTPLDELIFIHFLFLLFSIWFFIGGLDLGHDFSCYFVGILSEFQSRLPSSSIVGVVFNFNSSFFILSISLFGRLPRSDVPIWAGEDPKTNLIFPNWFLWSVEFVSVLLGSDMADALSVIPAFVLRNLSDKLYEKRKNAALEVYFTNHFIAFHF